MAAPAAQSQVVRNTSGSKAMRRPTEQTGGRSHTSPPGRRRCGATPHASVRRWHGAEVDAVVRGPRQGHGYIGAASGLDRDGPDSLHRQHLVDVFEDAGASGTGIAGGSTWRSPQSRATKQTGPWWRSSTGCLAACSTVQLRAREACASCPSDRPAMFSGSKISPFPPVRSCPYLSTSTTLRPSMPRWPPGVVLRARRRPGASSSGCLADARHPDVGTVDQRRRTIAVVSWFTRPELSGAKTSATTA